MLPSKRRSAVEPAVRWPVCSGTMIRATSRAAGSEMIEAATRCPSALSITVARVLAYRISTTPDTVDMPRVITMNSSARLMRSR